MIKIVFLIANNTLKAKKLVSYINKGNLFDKYNIILAFDEEPDINTEKFDYIVVSKKCKIPASVEYDILISNGWGWKIPEHVINRAKINSINCHSSFLPDYKGGGVTQHYWANCEKEAGISIHYLTKKFDEGNIILQRKIKISIFDKPWDILIKQVNKTNEVLLESINLVIMKSKGIKQVGGRYFIKTSGKKLKIHRYINLIFRLLNLKIRFYTRHRK